MKTLKGVFDGDNPLPCAIYRMAFGKSEWDHHMVTLADLYRHLWLPGVSKSEWAGVKSLIDMAIILMIDVEFIEQKFYRPVDGRSIIVPDMLRKPRKVKCVEVKDSVIINPRMEEPVIVGFIEIGRQEEKTEWVIEVE